jgi:Zn finger protein HypA/HybF involved in hydrogenase expression
MIWWLLLPPLIPSVLAQVAPNTRSPHGNLNLPCQDCHTVYGWKPIRAVPEFDHNQTRFPLRGMHEGVTCTGCHTKMVFSNVGNKCANCHADIHKARMGAACENCHSVRGWKVSVTQINQHMNRFPLTGAHAAASCDDCHKSGALSQYNTMSTACYSCHQKDYQGAQTPNHAQSGFTTTCESCHSTDTWLDAKFDHSLTNFPLTGGHAVPPRACTDCHVHNNYNLTQTACVSCHLKDFTNASNPNHAQMGFAQTCESCHTTAAWSPAQFDHSKSGFPLTGAHTVPPRTCSDVGCHAGNNFNLTQTTCVSCHQTDFNNTSNPSHVQGNFPATCEICHNTSTWSPASFDHSKSGFPLTGGHTVPPRACTDCHVNANYNITDTSCVSCHQTDYNNAKTPVDHIGAHFPTTCATCHDTTNWMDGTFNHSATGWALTGMHTVPPRACSDCHVNSNYNITNTSCVSCHQTDYNNAKTPVDHIQAGFPTTCDTCHDTINWMDGKFNHAQTGWALTGSHTVPPRACSDCHVNSNYKLNQTACITCHQTDYNNTNNPPHAQVGFPTTCEVCHDTIVWTDSTFDHSKTAFPLTGSHTVPPRVCTDCHVNNNWTTLPTDCYGCHKADYQSTNNPNHAAAGFPTTCATCHDTKVWTDATFNHTWFPTTHGGANGVCSTCHTNPNDYSVFTCTNCHLKPQTDQNHQGVSGYVYNSVNCYQCHKSGGGGG